MEILIHHILIVLLNFGILLTLVNLFRRVDELKFQVTNYKKMFDDLVKELERQRSVTAKQLEYHSKKHK